jgi:hypothetical protein
MGTSVCSVAGAGLRERCLSSSKLCQFLSHREHSNGTDRFPGTAMEPAETFAPVAIRLLAVSQY